MPRLVLVVLMTCSAVSLAAAADIDLSKPYGNADGCMNLVQQEFYSESMMVLTHENLVTATSACSILKITKNGDGSLTLSASCSAEGEEGETPASLIIRHSKRSTSALTIFDDDGNDFGDVMLCK